MTSGSGIRKITISIIYLFYISFSFFLNDNQSDVEDFSFCLFICSCLLLS